MRVETHTTDRKALAKAIGLCISRDVHYDGVPACSYSIGPVKVLRDGAVEWEDEAVEAAMTEFCRNNGWLAEEAVELEAGNRPADSEELPESRTELSVPIGSASPAQIRNLVFTLYSRQDLINRMTQSDMLCLPDTLIDRLRESLPESAEGFTSLLDDPETSAGLKGFDIREGKVRVAFPYDETRPERWTAYATLLNRIYDAAMKATRVSPARTKPDDGNEKYQAHAWLQRLGYGGADSKADRKVLIGHLKGYAAFKDESRMRAHLDRLAARRAAAKETHENDNA